MSGTVSHRSEAGHCATHGSFRRVLMRLPSGPVYIGRCSQCDADRRAEDARRARVQRVGELYIAATLPPRFEGKGFSEFIASTKLQRAAKAACVDYAKHIAERVENGTCLVLLGPPGIGKTHLLTALIASAVRDVVPARYLAAADFLALVGANWAWNGAGDEAQALVRAPLLAIDELWAPSGERERDALFALVDARYRARRATLLASNLTWPALRDALGERLCDRLLEDGGCVLALDGASRRACK